MYEIQGYYGDTHGWETVDTADTYADARDSLLNYLENEPEWRHRVHVRRGDDVL